MASILSEKTKIGKKSCEKSMKFKLKSTVSLWAVCSYYMVLAKAEVSCCLVLNVKAEQHTNVSDTTFCYADASE